MVVDNPFDILTSDGSASYKITGYTSDGSPEIDLSSVSSVEVTGGSNSQLLITLADTGVIDLSQITHLKLGVIPSPTYACQTSE